MTQPVTAPKPSPVGVVAKIRAHGPKYSAVSVVNVVMGQGLLLLFHAVLGLESWTSNILAVCISAVPAYYLTRAWVWGKRGRSHLTKEVLPFWGFALAGLLLSTLAVWAASSLSSNPLVPNLANIAAFGILWVIKFFVLDAFIFGRHHHPDTGPSPIL
jgi:putative flippase GtrA